MRVWSITIYYILAIISQVVVSEICNNRGKWNTVSQSCICKSPYYGVDCIYQRCPFGSNWLGIPYGDEIKNTSRIQCSNVGKCDRITGTCVCRDGFEGKACERLKCASTTVALIAANSLASVSESQLCSGRGRCLLAGEAARIYNDKVSYTGWDSKSISGCVCDQGWEGYDCSRRTCPRGVDPLDTSIVKGSTENIYIMECMATAGYFSVYISNQYSFPIPHDADVALLKYILELIDSIDEVFVLSNNADICGANAPTRTEFIITYNNLIKSQPVAFLSKMSSSSRIWNDSTQSLVHGSGSGDPILRFKTEYVLTCPICPSCSGAINFRYGQSISHSVSIVASNAHKVVESAIRSLSDLMNDWPQANLTVTFSNTAGNDRICDTTSKSSVTISFTSNYAIMAKCIQIIDGTNAGLVFSSNVASKTTYECSNQGLCDRSLGICQCLQYDGVVVKSSDGLGGIGRQGDCGYIEATSLNCALYSFCSGHGACDSSTGHCVCHAGWKGFDCSIGSCPFGVSFFTAGLSSDIHALAECSDMGVCDRGTGKCACRQGFTGTACQYHDCSRGANGNACDNRGICMNLQDYYSLYGYTYNGWDKGSVLTCACDSIPKNLTTVHDFVPRLISGLEVIKPPILGQLDYDCSSLNN